MGLRVPERVHLIPVGHEYERVIAAADQLRADKVILINHVNNDQYGEECWENILDAFKASEMEYDDSNECDIFDLYDSLGTISKEVSNHREEEVYVNVSTGSKITAIAGMITSMVLGSTAYYARVESYPSPETSYSVPKDISQIIELPPYSIDAPDSEQVKILEFIQRKMDAGDPPTKGDLIYFSEHEHLPFIRQNVAGKGKYRLIDNNIIDPLVSRGYITVTQKGRSKIITLTESGRAALEAFRWLDEEDTDWTKVIEETSSD